VSGGQFGARERDQELQSLLALHARQLESAPRIALHHGREQVQIGG
jgi:hypothetical protein